MELFWLSVVGLNVEMVIFAMEEIQDSDSLGHGSNRWLFEFLVIRLSSRLISVF